MPEMLLVGRRIRTCDEYIIQIYEGEIDVPKHAIHQPLESLGGIFQAEWHAKELKQSKRCYDGGFGYIMLRHWDLMKSPYQIHNVEDRHARQATIEVLDVG